MELILFLKIATSDINIATIDPRKRDRTAGLEMEQWNATSRRTAPAAVASAVLKQSALAGDLRPLVSADSLGKFLYPLHEAQYAGQILPPGHYVYLVVVPQHVFGAYADRPHELH